MLTSVQKGSITEGVVLAALLRAGYTVLLPFGPMRYDIVIDRGEGFKKVQTKTARILHDNTLSFNVASTSREGEITTYTADEIDFFAVWCPEVPDSVYLIPVADLAGVKRSATLRYGPPRNGKRLKTMRDAAPYALIAQRTEQPAPNG